MNSASSFAVPSGYRADNPHRALPVRGTYVSERTGRPAVLTDEGCYPITAQCQVCQGPIRLEQLIQMEWRHAPSAPGRP